MAGRVNPVQLCHLLFRFHGDIIFLGGTIYFSVLRDYKQVVNSAR